MIRKIKGTLTTQRRAVLQIFESRKEKKGISAVEVSPKSPIIPEQWHHELQPTHPHVFVKPRNKVTRFSLKEFR